MPKGLYVGFWDLRDFDPFPVVWRWSEASTNSLTANRALGRLRVSIAPLISCSMAFLRLSLASVAFASAARSTSRWV